MNISHRLQNLKLNQRFALILGTVAVGFLILALTYGYVIRVGLEAEHRAARIETFGNHVVEFSKATEYARRQTRDFQTLYKLEYLEKYDAYLKSARDYLEKLRVEIQDSDRDILKQIAVVLGEYQATFHRNADAIVAYGMTSGSGLRGELHKATQTLENQLLRDKNPALLKFLEVRRYEADYLQNVNEADWKAYEQAAKSLRPALEAADPATRTAFNRYDEVFRQAATTVKRRVEEQLATRATVDRMVPMIERLIALKDRYREDSAQRVKADSRFATWVFVVAMALTALAATGLLLLVSLSIARPVRRLADTVARLDAGDYSARAGLASADELGEFARALDKLLDERVASLAQTEADNKRLNRSVVQLLKAVSELSRHDLSVRVPVTEDIAGPVADALNLLSQEMVKVLRSVTDTSAEVDRTSGVVKDHAHRVMEEAALERREIERTVTELAEAVATMHHIAQLAQAADASTGNASAKTDSALASVGQTVTGIGHIREAIHEAEKRIKRLGERTQEIGGAVNLVGGIAERTHFLALNASMHAAAAGEAGRGFMVVADEVQRLAENSREATTQIDALIRNVQTEMADVVATINTLIGQVVEGSRRAEAAGEHMRDTQEATAELIASIRQIAADTQRQIETMLRLQDQARQVHGRTQATTRQLEEQTRATDRMTERARQLLDTVRVFKLPEAA